MFGAICGDIIGSRFERKNIKTEDFELFTRDCNFTDDTVMTLAVCDAILYNDNPVSFLITENVRKSTQSDIRHIIQDILMQASDRCFQTGQNQKDFIDREVTETAEQ